MLFLRLLAEEGPNTELAWILWIGLGFFFLMVAVGWLVSRRKSS
jgi:LPXTG-motif cell wall-anchored protein